MKTGLRRPGLEPGPITTAVNVASGWSRYPANNKHWWLMGWTAPYGIDVPE